MSQKLLHAVEFAAKAHAGQTRKFSGEPYIVHPVAVARLAARFGLSEDAQVAAVLHDVVEDTEVSIEEVRDFFGPDVALMVWGLTNAKTRLAAAQVNIQLNRAARKAIDRDFLRAQGAEVRALKLLDLAHNLSDWPRDDSFLDLFLDEAAQLHSAIQEGVNDKVRFHYSGIYLRAVKERQAQKEGDV